MKGGGHPKKDFQMIFGLPAKKMILPYCGRKRGKEGAEGADVSLKEVIRRKIHTDRQGKEYNRGATVEGRVCTACAACLNPLPVLFLADRAPPPPPHSSS